MPQKVDVILQNRTAYIPNSEDADQLRDGFMFRVDGWQYTPAAKYRGWDGYIRMMSYNRVGTGVFLYRKEALEKELDLEFVIQDERTAPKLRKWTPPAQARDYQIECVQKMRSCLTGGLILNATGTGKTFIAGLYCQGLAGSLLFLVDELTLLKQAREEIEKVSGEEVGEIGDSIFNPKRITVATIQTVHLHRRDPKFSPWRNRLDVMILDEIHLALNKRNLQTVKLIEPSLVFGLTATLELKKNAVAMKSYEMAGPVIYSYPLAVGVQQGVLAKGIAISVEVKQQVNLPEFQGGSWIARRNFYMRRYPIEYRMVVVEGRKRNGFIVELTREAHASGKYTIILVDRVKHLLSLSSALSDLPHEKVFGEKRANQRVLSKLKFEVGQSRIIITNKVFKKGVDIKRVDVIIDAAGMKSRNDAVQKYGRGVRVCDEKKGLLYFDIADADNRLDKAAKGRRLALKKIGVPVYRLSSTLGAKRVLMTAQSRLDELVEDLPITS